MTKNGDNTDTTDTTEFRWEGATFTAAAIAFGDGSSAVGTIHDNGEQARRAGRPSRADSTGSTAVKGGAMTFRDGKVIVDGEEQVT